MNKKEYTSPLLRCPFFMRRGCIISWYR